MAARTTRSISVEESLLRKIQRMDERGERRAVRTWSRASTVLPEFVGHTVAIHNGSTFVTVRITESMVGRKLGELAPSRTIRKQGRIMGRASVESEAEPRQSSYMPDPPAPADPASAAVRENVSGRRAGKRITPQFPDADRGQGARLPPAIRRGDKVTITSTEAQNGFGRVLDAVAKEGTVLITKRNVTQAVVISAERYEALTRAEAPQLDELTAEFDAMLAGMQGPASREAMRAAFASSPDELGQTAFAAAQSLHQ